MTEISRATAPAAALPTEPRELVRGLVERIWNRRDLDAITAAYAPDAAVHVPGYDTGGVQDVVDDASHYQQAFDDIAMTIEDLLVDGDRVVLRWRTVGTHTGTYYGHEATGRRITMTGVDIFRVAEGRIRDVWTIWDGLDVYRQLGLLPDGL
jgi:steroid delta-isomerase-like uncharacterized protein